MILTRSTRLIQPQGPVEISPEFGGRGVVYLPNVRSGIALAAGAVGRFPTQHGISASYSTGAETKIERLNGSAPNGITEFTQLVYLTPIAGGIDNDRGLFGNRNTTGITSFIQLVHQARDAAANGRYCYRLFYKPTSAAAEVSVRTGNDTSINDAPSVVVASAKNGKLSIYHNGALQGSTAVTLQSVSGQLDLQFGNYYDNSTSRRLSAQIHLGAFLPRGVTDAEAFALSRNPWQLFRPVQRRVYFDMGAGGGAGDVILTGANAAQPNTSTSGAISQTHHLAGANAAGSTTSTSGAITQTHVLTGVNATQANTSTSSAISQIGNLTGANCEQPNTSSGGPISQVHVLAGASCAQSNASTSGSIIVTNATVLTGANCAQSNATTSGAISQTHVLVGAPVAIDNISSASAIVQNHILSGANCFQSNTTTTGSINNVVIPSQFVAYVPSGVFSASVQSGEYSATVPSGNFRASL